MEGEAREAMEEGGREGRRGEWREEEKREGGLGEREEGRLGRKTFRERWRNRREKIRRERGR